MTRHGQARCTPLLAVLSLVLATSAGAAGGSDGLDRWVPEIDVSSGILIYSGSASNTSTFDINGAEVRPPTTGQPTMTPPLLGADLGFMAPAFSSLPGSPRLFARGGASLTFATQQRIAKEGNPQKLDPSIVVTNPDLIDGQGSSLGIELKSPVYDAGGGVAFAFGIGDRNLRVRTSLEYMRQTIQMRGRVEDVRSIFGLPFFFEIRSGETRSFDAIGPGVELELDTRSYGPFMTSIFAGGRAYHYLGDRKLDISVPGQCYQNGVPCAVGTTANFRYKLDPWAYRLLVGFRIRWQPR